MHICLVSNNRTPVQGTTLILRSGDSRVSKDRPQASWLETREDALLTMRGGLRC
jgi:hypothetical protein